MNYYHKNRTLNLVRARVVFRARSQFRIHARERPFQICVILASYQRGPFQNRAVLVHG